MKTYSLPRARAETHPLSASSSLPIEVDVADHVRIDFSDPLRASESDAKVAAYIEDSQDEENSLVAIKAEIQLPAKEWVSYKKFLMQRFPIVKLISISMSNVIIKSGNEKDKSSVSMHLEELDDPQKFVADGVKVISQLEYVSRLNELKDEINRAWLSDDRVTSLKLSIKVARLLMDTSVAQFYPTLFVLPTDIMDMLGDMVWERIRWRAEFAEDGTLICSLPENFEASNVCFDAKETCNNWFCKIGSITELLPRIYLELAILPCSRFLLERPVDNLQRLVRMTRGIADPLASAYCRLYLVHRAQKLPQFDIGHLIACINDIKVLLTRIISGQEVTCKGDRSLLISLMEPPIEYIVKSIFKESHPGQLGDILLGLELGRSRSELFEKSPCISIILHHLLKELPIEVINSNSLEILHLIECSGDCSSDQCLNYNLLGLRLSERISQVSRIDAVMDKVIQVISKYKSLDEYLKVVDGYVDIVLQKQMDSYLNTILNSVFERACYEEITENEMASLQSVLVKLLGHVKNLEDIFLLNHFIEILDVMCGSSRRIVNMHILDKATRNGCIRDPTMIQFLFEVSQALHDGIDFSNMRNDDNKQSARLISRFVDKVDHGLEMERHLTFLVECRGAFGSINKLKETLVHSSNHLAARATKDGRSHINFVKSCLAFCEVTIPAIPAQSTQLNLYLETAEVALLCGLISHSDGLLDSAISCLQGVVSGLRTPNNADVILSLTQKICSFVVMIPGNPKQGITYISKSILSILNSNSWMTLKMRTRVLCDILSLSAALSQNELQHKAIHRKVMGNDRLFFGDPAYLQEYKSLSAVILQDIVGLILQEPSKDSRGNMALEACNCVVSLFRMSHEISAICSKLLETAKLCLAPNNKCLQYTIRILNSHMSESPEAGS